MDGQGRSLLIAYGVSWWVRVREKPFALKNNSPHLCNGSPAPRADTREFSLALHEILPVEIIL